MYKNVNILQLNYKDKREIVAWQCPSCVYRYPEEWFDKFDQFEDFILREGDSPKDWKKLNKKKELIL
jgi:hypothetical protein